MPMKRTEKLALLNRILSGETADLKTLRQQRGRRYTQAELEAQQAYLSESWGKLATKEETETFFGLYDMSQVPNSTAYCLPNGMLLFF